MLDLGNFGWGSAAIVATIILLLLTPLFGEILGRFFEEATTFIARPLRAFAEIIESVKDWTLRVVGLRFSRQEAAPQSAQPTAQPQPQPATSTNSGPVPATTVDFAESAPTGSLSQPVAAPQPVAAQPVAPQASEHGQWHIEAFVAEFLYFALVIAVCLVDLVYSAERMAIIILNQEGGVDFGPLNFLRDLGSGLAGVLFVGIGLLAGMLVFDLLDVLPRGVQLFPNIKPRARRILLICSAVVLGMAAVAAALLWALGQTVVDNLNVSFPELEYAVDVLLAVVLIFVVTLGVWGLIKGLAALGAVLLVVASGLLWVLSHLLIAAADVIQAIGRAINDVFVEIYHLFHPDRREPEYAPYGGGRLVVIGLGQHSSSFASQLCMEIRNLAGSKQLLGAGVYAQNGTVYGKARARLREAGVAGGVARGPRNLSVEPNQQPAMQLLEKNVVRAYHEADPQGIHRTVTPRHLVWVVDPDEVAADGNYLLQHTENMLQDWRQQEHPPVPGLTVTIVCLLPHRLPKALEEAQVLDKLATIVKEADRSGEVALTPAVLIIRDNAGASGIGSETALNLFARSLAGSLVSTAMKDFNSGLLQALAKLQENDYPFVAFSADAIGIISSSAGGQRNSRGLPFLNDAVRRTEDLAKRLFEGNGALSVRVPPDEERSPIAAVCMAPISAQRAEATTYKDTITRWYAHPDHYVPLVDFVLDEHVDGIDISHSRPEAIGDRYVQIAHIYGIESVDAALGKAPAREAAQAPIPISPFDATPGQSDQRQPAFVPSYDPQPMYGQEPTFGQQPTYGLPPSYGLHPSYGQPPSYGQQSLPDADAWLNYPNISPDASNANGHGNGNGSQPRGPWNAQGES